MKKICPECNKEFECNNATRVFCNRICQRKYAYKISKLQREGCPACFKPTKEWGKEYNYLCIDCELVAMNINYEEEIKDTKDYL